MFSIKIQGKDYSQFDNLTLTRKFNALASSFSFNANFDIENADQRKLFRPYGFRKCEIFSDGILQLTGVILTQKFLDAPQPTLTALSGYSVTGVLQDCQIPTSAYPLQSDNKTLNEIARNLVSKFGLTLVSKDSAANQVIEISTAKSSQTVLSYISSIAAQKNLVLTHDEQGRVVIAKISSSLKPVASLREQVGTEMSLECNGQTMHDEATVIRQASLDDDNAGESSERNVFVSQFSTNVSPTNPSVSNFRPTVKELSSGSNESTITAARNILSNEYRNIKLTIKLDSWYLGDRFVKVGELISVQNPRLYLPNETSFFIESVTYGGDPSKQTAVITAVIPEVYNGAVPVNIFE